MILLDHNVGSQNGGPSLPNLSSDDVENIIQDGSAFRHPAPSNPRGAYTDPPYSEVHSLGMIEFFVNSSVFAHIFVKVPHQETAKGPFRCLNQIAT